MSRLRCFSSDFNRYVSEFMEGVGEWLSKERSRAEADKASSGFRGGDGGGI